MESWQTAVVVVVSLVAGALLPVLVQLSLTLRSARVALERTSARLDRTLDALAATAERIDKATRVASAVGAAVGPAVGAAVRAWRAGHPEEGDGGEHRAEAAGPEGAGKGETQ
jgi:hypothetical protein